ncbi:MAG: hypothetical protein K6G08_05550 [Prevotella sp.]|nr:hypothetical protein [Prevotella sp.]
MTREKGIIIAARVISIVFTPFYLPLVGQIALFSFSYMNQMPKEFKLQVLLLTYLFTILIPTMLIYLYRKLMGWTLRDLSRKHRRIVPYAISIASYLTCVHLMYTYHIFHFIVIIIIAALVVQAACVLINIFWKISTHTAAVGGVAGGLLAFAELFMFNPVMWLCLVLIVAGVLGSARIILRQHTLGQVVAGFIVGFFCSGYTILYI